MSYETIKSIKKAMEILELLSDRTQKNEILTLADITSKGTIKSATARNILRTLEELGYIYRVGHGKYIEGKNCCKLFATGQKNRNLIAISEKIVPEIVSELKGNVIVATLENSHRIELAREYISKEEDFDYKRWYMDNVSYYRLYLTRVLLAYSSTDQLDFFVKMNGLPSLSDWPECQENYEILKEQLRIIRFAGGCYALTEYFFVAALPIYNQYLTPIAALGIYGPSTNISIDETKQIFKKLQIYADKYRNYL